MVVVPRDRRRRYGFFYAHDGEFIDSEWDEIGVDTVLAACRRALDRYGVINLHPDGYASAQLQTPLICRPGTKPWQPLLPQIGWHNSFDWGPTPGHWAERRRERDRRKSLPAEPSPPLTPEVPPPKPFGGHPWQLRPPPLPAIEAPDLESALRQFYQHYGGRRSDTEALYRSTVLRFLPGYQFPAHLR